MSESIRAVADSPERATWRRALRRSLGSRNRGVFVFVFVFVLVPLEVPVKLAAVLAFIAVLEAWRRWRTTTQR
ncbi:MAG: hypothetical protein F4064_01160 [Acidimicrobiales bacterium]|nr:hypothetical protein [Acidimicrobiales bacterium]MYI26681.1 hypothetical protein [Acidimicrobiales bacterium]